MNRVKRNPLIVRPKIRIAVSESQNWETADDAPVADLIAEPTAHNTEHRSNAVHAKRRAEVDHRESERGVGVARVERRVRKERESDKAK